MFSRWHVAVVRSLAPLLTALCAVALIHGTGHAGTLDVSWTAPTTTVTGMPLTNLAGYRVYYGTAGTGCPGATYVTVPSPTSAPSANQTLTWTLSGLTTGTAYNVGVTAVDTAGQESACVTSATATVARSDFSVTPTSTVSFGTVTVGSSATQTFSVQNSGQTAISGSAAATTPFSVVAGSPYNLAPGASATVSVRFSPTAAAQATSNVSFVGPDGSSISRAVSGTGVAATTSPGGSTPPPPAADTTPPTIALTAPASMAKVSGSTVIITATASDNVGVVGVQFKVNDFNLGSEVTAPPYQISWYTLSTPNGTNTLTAVARDAAGNKTTSAPVTVILNNGSGGASTSQPAPDTTPPTVSIASTAATTGAAALTLSGTAADNVGVTQVAWTNNRGGSGTASGTTSWTASGIPLVTGANVITVIARDAAGNTGQSSVTITKTDTTAPTVSLTVPTNGAVVSGSAVILTAAAADDVAVVGVQFKVNGLNLGSEVTTPPYQISWYTLSTPNGTHTLTAVARDAAGNTTTSAPVAVTLSNGGAAAVPAPASTSVPAPAPLAYDNSVSSGFQWGVTSVTTPAVVVGTGANRAAMIMVAMSANNATNITASLGGVAATLIPGTDSGTTAPIRTLIFQVINPPSGSQTARVSWTTPMHAEVGVLTVTGANQTTPTSNGQFTAFNASPSVATSVTIPSNPGDLTASVAFTTNQWISPATNQTFAWGPSSSPAQGDRGSGAGTTTHTWTDLYVGIPHSVSGANFVAARQ
jgi:hypothetical protein